MSAIQTQSPFLNRGAIRARGAAINQMADDLRVGAAVRGSVTEDDLKLLGWKASQIAIHGPAAQAKAFALSEG